MRHLKLYEEFSGPAKAAKFSIDDSAEYQGWTFGETWNGFACPYFEKDVADKMTKDFSDEDWKLYYDAKKNSFIHEPKDEQYETEEFEVTTIDTLDGKKEVWPIGAYFWVWEEA
jgi:hypothetical protein